MRCKNGTIFCSYTVASEAIRDKKIGGGGGGEIRRNLIYMIILCILLPRKSELRTKKGRRGRGNTPSINLRNSIASSAPRFRRHCLYNKMIQS